MRRAVRTDQARAVDRKDDVQSAQRHIVQQLVVGALEKARIHGEHRERALLGKARRHRGGVSLGDADVKKAVGETPGKGRETRAVLHRRGDRAHARVLLGQLRERRAEDGGKAFLRRRNRAGRSVERSDAVEFPRLTLGRRVAVPLLRADMDEHRALHLPRPFERGGELREVVPVHRAEVGEAHVLEHRGVGQHGLFESCFERVIEAVERTSDRRAAQCVVVRLLEGEVFRLCAQAREMLAHRADVAVDGHTVVVEDNDQRLAGGAGVVESLIGKAAGERAVADEGKHAVILVQHRAGARHAERHGDGVGGVTGDEGVVYALAGLGKARDAAELPQRRKAVRAAGEYFMDVALMPHVKNEAVARRVEHAVDGDGQLHHTEVRGEVPAGMRDLLDEKAPQLPAEQRKLRLRKRLDVVRGMDSV